MAVVANMRRCSWKRMGLGAHAQQLPGLVPSGEIIVSRVWSGEASPRAAHAGCAGVAGLAGYTAGQQAWQQRGQQDMAFADTAVNETRRVTQHGNRHVSAECRWHPTNCQLHLPCWASMGKVDPGAGSPLPPATDR